jgi:SAM-dependent methyltransferase
MKLPIPYGRLRRFRERLLAVSAGAMTEEKKAYLLFNSHRYLRMLDELDAVLEPGRPLRLLDVAPCPELTRMIVGRPGLTYASAAGGFYLDRPTKPRVAAETVRDERGAPHEVQCATDVNLERDRLPFPDHAFDVVLMLEVIEHFILDPVHALVEIGRVLKPGGKLVLTTDNANHFIRLMKFLALRPIFWPYAESTFGDRHNREYLAAEIDALLRGLGYRDVRVRTFNWLPFLPGQSLEKYAGYTLGNALTALPPFNRYRRHILAVATGGEIKPHYPTNLFIKSAREADVWR